MKSSAPDVSGKGGALAKPGETGGYKKVLANKAKELLLVLPRKLAVLLLNKQPARETLASGPRVSRTPPGSAIDVSGKKSFSDTADEKQNIGKGGTDKAYGGYPHLKERKPDPKMAGMKKMQADKEKKAKKTVSLVAPRRVWWRLLPLDDEKRRQKRTNWVRKQAKPFCSGQNIGRGSTKFRRDGLGVSYGFQQSGLR